MAVILLLGAWTVADARRPYNRSVPGAFDYYLLSLSIAPSFCATDRGRSDKTECTEASDAAYRETPLTVHGLWPNRIGVAGRNQPGNCDGPPLGSLPDSLRADLARYMPGSADGLDRYEWRKHGTCSGLDPAAYFSALITAAKEADRVIGGAIQSHGWFGRPVPIAELLDAVSETNPALARSIVVNCRFRRKGAGESGGAAVIQDIRVVLSRDFPGATLGPGAFVPLSEVGFQANSGCPAGAGLLPAGFGAV
ncbi:MAG: hypothetical protein JOZ42_06710 [Acetobacteraceae bacterium]|nr:hypothetical protein [Acetobacteraceae bacterium]